MACPPPAQASEHVPTDRDILVQAVVAEDYSCAKCSFRPPSEGGRVLVTTRKVKRGEVVGRAASQKVVGKPRTAKENALWAQVVDCIGTGGLDYDLEIVWSALHCFLDTELPICGFPLGSISEKLQQRILLHHIPDDTAPSAKMIKLHQAIGLRCTALELARMVALWSCNCLDHTSRKDTSVLSVGFALMNHSCLPSVSWCFDGDTVVLRAIMDLELGDELTDSYMEDHQMHKPTQLRREYIIQTGKGFTCGCVRCSDPKERCRRICCPATGCTGTVPLGVAGSELCEKCGRGLSAAESADLIAREKELMSLLNKFQLFDADVFNPNWNSNYSDRALVYPVVRASDLSKENIPDSNAPNGGDLIKEAVDESMSSSEESDSDTTDLSPEQLFRVEDLSTEQVEWVRETATSGRLFASTGHWLAHEAHALLKDVAWSRKAGPATVLACLDARAAFVRQAYELAAPNHPPSEQHGWELLEAAELLMKSDGWPEAMDPHERKVAAQTRLRECIEVLEPMNGEGKFVLKARKLLLNLDAGAETIIIAKGVKRSRSPATA